MAVLSRTNHILISSVLAVTKQSGSLHGKDRSYNPTAFPPWIESIPQSARMTLTFLYSELKLLLLAIIQK